MGLKKGQRNAGTIKKGEIRNPNGRPKDRATINGIKRECNNNIKEMKTLFEKYYKMPYESFIKLAQQVQEDRVITERETQDLITDPYKSKKSKTKNLKKSKTKLSLQEILTILYLYDAYRGNEQKFEIVKDIITGQWRQGKGFHDVREEEDVPQLYRELEMYVQTDYKPTFEITTDLLIRFMLENPDTFQEHPKMISQILNTVSRMDLSKLNMVEISRVQAGLERMSEVLRETVGRRDPQLFLNVILKFKQVTQGMLANDVDVKTIEAESIPVKKKSKSKKKQ